MDEAVALSLATRLRMISEPASGFNKISRRPLNQQTAIATDLGAPQCSFDRHVFARAGLGGACMLI